jgi:hypothetical protein
MAVPVPTNSPPTLQRPGAGLPWWEWLVARYFLFPRACRKLRWEGAGRLFQAEGAKVLALWDALPTDRLTERVLIRRLPGIEDSSRYWSVAMTVEHLTIVGFAIGLTIRGLRRGQLPSRPARVEDVKPRGEMPPAEVRADFVRLLAKAASADAGEPPMAPGEGLRYPHPWFGPMDAYQWHCLRGIHQRIHRKQIESIRAGLGIS